MTYTIIAKDKQTGQIGIAVQTFNLAVGAWVPWAEGGVGAVATQALTRRSYGPHGLELMRGGKSSDDALEALLSVDSMAEVRQIGMMDREGHIAVHTGARCFPQAGTYTGDGFVTLANMMLNDTVWHAMADAYTRAEGDFAGRMMAALYAAQLEGGDMRGKQTAAMLIVDSEPNPVPILDLRVDRNADPLGHLEKLIRLYRAYMAEYRIAELVASGNTEQAYRMLDIIEAEAPDETYLQYLRALHLAGRLDAEEEALEILKKLCTDHSVWRLYLEREAKVDNFGIPGLGSRLLKALEG